ncbi:CapA family protein [Emcibacter sp.]|uniref:CapA family protein n=1 Tax=Emcibacter sp. TaxID=1979954 RepID=UPI003A95B811
MNKYITFLIICLFLVVPGSQASQSFLSGIILDEQGRSVENVSIRLDGAEVRTGRNGQYRLATAGAGLFRLVISAEGHYSIVHSFADLELEKDKNGYRVPPIVLVRKKPGRVMLAFGGDAMMGRRFKDPERGEPKLIRPGHEEEDAAAILSSITPYMALADFASVNMETPLMDVEPKAAAPKSYVFYSPTTMLSALKKAGVDFVSLGNNHVNDFIEEGATSTMRALKNSAIGFSGGGMNRAESLKAWRQEINGVKTSHLGFVGWKGRVTPNQVADGPDKSGAAYGSDENIRQTVLTENEASDLVVMQYHGSREYSYGPSKTTEGRMKLAVDSGADLIIGHHPHVVHGFEIYQDKLIAYSLGNFVFDQYRYETHPSVLLYVWMDGDKFHRAEVVPLYIKNYRPTPAVGNIRQYVLRRLADQSSRRGVILSRSGGHAVVQAGGQALQPVKVARINGGSKILPLEFPWYSYPLKISGDTGAFRLGRDRLLFGDFEQEGLWGLSDRNWIYPDETCAVQSEVVYRGSHALCLPGGSRTELKNFIRTHDYVPGAPLTLHGFIRAGKEAPLNVSLGFWDQGARRAAALKKGRMVQLGRIEAEGDEWREFSIEFPAPDKKKVKGFRLILENGDDSGEAIYLDDLSLVEWQADMSGKNKKDGINPLFRMDFVEFNATPAEPSVVIVEGYSAPLATDNSRSAQTITIN